MCAVMLFNMVIFICIVVVLVRHTRATAARKTEAVNRKTIIRLMISISGVMFLLGFSWMLFAISYILPYPAGITLLIPSYLLQTFQGLFIFIFICVLNKEVVELWKEFLSCRRYKSKLLHPTQTYRAARGSPPSEGKSASERSKSDCEYAILSDESASIKGSKKVVIGKDLPGQSCYSTRTAAV